MADAGTTLNELINLQAVLAAKNEIGRSDGVVVAQGVAIDALTKRIEAIEAKLSAGPVPSPAPPPPPPPGTPDDPEGTEKSGAGAVVRWHQINWSISPDGRLLKDGSTKDEVILTAGVTHVGIKNANLYHKTPAGTWLFSGNQHWTLETVPSTTPVLSGSVELPSA